LRIGHVYGPGEEAYLKIIPETFKKIINKESVKIWGTGEDLRSFIYIDDVVEATINAIDLDEEVGVINVVGSQAISIKELVSKIIDITGHNHTIEYISTNEKPRNLSFNNSKLVKYLLKKETDLDVGLTNEYNYFLNLSN
jgi:nucleoside-diphosphate-sugar epimerase